MLGREDILELSSTCQHRVLGVLLDGWHVRTTLGRLSIHTAPIVAIADSYSEEPFLGRLNPSTRTMCVPVRSDPCWGPKASPRGDEHRIQHVMDTRDIMAPVGTKADHMASNTLHLMLQTCQLVT